MKTLLKKRRNYIEAGNPDWTCSACGSHKIVSVAYGLGDSPVYTCLECGKVMRPNQAFLERTYKNRNFVSSGIGGYMINRIEFDRGDVSIDNFFCVCETL